MFDKYIWYEIFYYLPNEDIFKLNQVNREFNLLIKNNIFYEEILYRDHPMVFNILDNYCTLCNIGLFVINEKDDIKMINCNHN